MSDKSSLDGAGNKKKEIEKIRQKYKIRKKYMIKEL